MHFSRFRIETSSTFYPQKSFAWQYSFTAKFTLIKFIYVLFDICFAGGGGGGRTVLVYFLASYSNACMFLFKLSLHTFLSILKSLLILLLLSLFDDLSYFIFRGGRCRSGWIPLPGHGWPWHGWRPWGGRRLMTVYNLAH